MLLALQSAYQSSVIAYFASTMELGNSNETIFPTVATSVVDLQSVIASDLIVGTRLFALSQTESNAILDSSSGIGLFLSSTVPETATLLDSALANLYLSYGFTTTQLSVARTIAIAAQSRIMTITNQQRSLTVPYQNRIVSFKA